MANSEEATACVRYSPLHAGGNRMIHVLERPRDVVRTIVLAAAVAAAPAAAQAQDYPSQDIRFICGFPCGRSVDLLVRYCARKLRKVGNRTIIIENKFVAAGNIAAIYTARAKPDGYTVYVHAASAIAANMHLFKAPPIDAGKDLQIAAAINKQPFMMVVAADSPYRTLAELTEAMKKKRSEEH